MQAAKALWKAVKETKLASQQILEVLNPGPLRVCALPKDTRASSCVAFVHLKHSTATTDQFVSLHTCTGRVQ